MAVTTKSSMMTFDTLDPEQLQAWGEVMLRHSHLDYILRMTIKTLAGVQVNEALDATRFTPSSELRQRVRRLARSAIGEGAALLKVEALLERCRQVTESRNNLVHNIVARELDGELKVRTSDHQWQDAPAAADLRDLAAKIGTLTLELNTARLQGFLKAALDRKR
jgi:hypothetical protein